jgi:hypothetical protein
MRRPWPALGCCVREKKNTFSSPTKQPPIALIQLCTINMNKAFYIPLVYMQYLSTFIVAIALYRYDTMLVGYKSEIHCQASDCHVMTSFDFSVQLMSILCCSLKTLQWPYYFTIANLDIVIKLYQIL